MGEVVPTLETHSVTFYTISHLNHWCLVRINLKGERHLQFGKSCGFWVSPMGNYNRLSTGKRASGPSGDEDALRSWYRNHIRFCPRGWCNIVQDPVSQVRVAGPIPGMKDAALNKREKVLFYPGDSNLIGLQKIHKEIPIHKQIS